MSYGFATRRGAAVEKAARFPWLHPERPYHLHHPTFWDCRTVLGWSHEIIPNPKTGKPDVLPRKRLASRRLENNTTLCVGATRNDGEPETFDIILHETAVVTLDSQTYTLRRGVWPSMTTADRIRRYSPAGLGSERGCWYVYWSGGIVQTVHAEPYNRCVDLMRFRVPFREGMRVNGDGIPVDPCDLALVQRQGRQRRRDGKIIHRWLPGWGTPDGWSPTACA